MIFDLIHSFPNISNLVDSLCENGDAQLIRSFLPDTLGNQLDSLEASMISLSSKMAVIDSINDDLVIYYYLVLVNLLKIKKILLIFIFELIFNKSYKIS